MLGNVVHVQGGWLAQVKDKVPEALDATMLREDGPKSNVFKAWIRLPPNAGSDKRYMSAEGEGSTPAIALGNAIVAAWDLLE